VLVDLALHIAAEPWARYSLVFPPLFAWCLIHDKVPARAGRDGFAWLALAILLELVAVGGGMTRFARPGLPLAAIGTCRIFGLGPGRTALLALWTIPVPKIVIAFASPGLETTLLRVASAAAGLLGADVGVEGCRAFAAAGQLELTDSDGGLPLAALLSGLGWYASLRCGGSLLACLRRAVAWAVLAIPLQLLGVLAAVTALAMGAPAVGRLLLDHGLWTATAAAGLAWAEHLRRRELSRHEC
jgi:hypothetical protein